MSNNGPCTAKATNTIARSGIEREYPVSAELKVVRSSPLAAVWIQKDHPGFTPIFTCPLPAAWGGAGTRPIEKQPWVLEWHLNETAGGVLWGCIWKILFNFILILRWGLSEKPVSAHELLHRRAYWDGLGSDL
jgi:hypothetical protein